MFQLKTAGTYIRVKKVSRLHTLYSYLKDKSGVIQSIAMLLEVAKYYVKEKELKIFI